MSANDLRKGCKVLLVEDHADTATVLSRLLKGLGYITYTAATLADARAQVAREWPDVMIVDLLLPDGNGVDLVRELKTIRPFQAIAFSGLGMERDRKLTSDAGFSAHLTKPATIDQLDLALRRACGPSVN